MRVSVITVCLNAARTIGHTLESFFRQDHVDKELVVVDGGSRDDTLRIVRSFGEAITIVSEPDEGIYHAANKGLVLYTGDAVGLLNSDDRFADEHALGHVADALASHDIAFGDLDFVADHDQSEIVRRWRGSAFVRGAFRRGWMPAHPTFYVRRSVIEALGGFDTRYRIAADYDFMLRALELGDFRASYINRVLVKMMHGGKSTAGLKSLMAHNYEALCSRQQWLEAGFVDYSLFAKPLRKLSQLAMPSFRSGWQIRFNGREMRSTPDPRNQPAVSRAPDDR